MEGKKKNDMNDGTTSTQALDDKHSKMLWDKFYSWQYQEQQRMKRESQCDKENWHSSDGKCFSTSDLI